MEDRRIANIYKDRDGWWMELNTGWAFDPAEKPYGGQHTTSERTKRELMKWRKQIKPCHCVSCSEPYTTVVNAEGLLESTER